MGDLVAADGTDLRRFDGNDSGGGTRQRNELHLEGPTGAVHVNDCARISGDKPVTRHAGPQDHSVMLGNHYGTSIGYAAIDRGPSMSCCNI